MKAHFLITCLVFAAMFVSVPACHKQSGDEDVAVSADTADIQKLEKFLGIPVYPGARIADIFTELRDDKVPDKKMDARVKLIIEEYEKIPPFYEKALGLKFNVETENDKKYYTLKFDRGDWEYEILVGHDTYMNQPIYEINMWGKSM